VNKLAVHTIECRNCNIDIHVDEYRTHLDGEGDLRQIHIYQICDKLEIRTRTPRRSTRFHPIAIPEKVMRKIKKESSKPKANVVKRKRAENSDDDAVKDEEVEENEGKAGIKPRGGTRDRTVASEVEVDANETAEEPRGGTRSHTPGSVNDVGGEGAIDEAGEQSVGGIPDRYQDFDVDVDAGLFDMSIKEAVIPSTIESQNKAVDTPRSTYTKSAPHPVPQSEHHVRVEARNGVVDAAGKGSIDRTNIHTPDTAIEANNSTSVPVWDEGDGEGAPRFPWELSDSE
jgi:hypothetical protein